MFVIIVSSEDEVDRVVGPFASRLEAEEYLSDNDVAGEKFDDTAGVWECEAPIPAD